MMALLQATLLVWLLAASASARTLQQSHTVTGTAARAHFLSVDSTVPTRTLQSVATDAAKPVPNSSPSDKCTPFDPAVYGQSNMDGLCAYFNTLSDKELFAMHANAHIPQATDDFPIRGCTMRCILGNSFAAVVAKDPYNNLGWGGKCFGFEFDQQTGVPTYLENIFSPDYDSSRLPDKKRVPGELHCRASVSRQPTSYSDGKPVYQFDHSQSENIYAPKMKKWLDIRSFRDEMRMVKPGFLLGRIFIASGRDVQEMPIFFALFQACTAQGTFPTTPEARATPRLGK